MPTDTLIFTWSLILYCRFIYKEMYSMYNFLKTFYLLEYILQNFEYFTEFRCKKP